MSEAFANVWYSVLTIKMPGFHTIAYSISGWQQNSHTLGLYYTVADSPYYLKVGRKPVFPGSADISGFVTPSVLP